MRRLGVVLAGLLLALAACGGDSQQETATLPPSSRPPTTSVVDDLEQTGLAWWNERVFYEIFVRSFKDSDGDGIGDLAGLTASLDYLNDGDPTTTDDLGITGIWLMPIFPSPSYHGYDVTDYRAINPDYGDLEDFRRFLDAAHQRGIAVLIDLVINHSSVEHPWFTASAQGDPDYADWYLWSDHNPGTTAPWGAPAWHLLDDRYYFGLFWEGMPDLNLEHDAVAAEIRDIAGFWLLDVGVDGFRLDAARHLIEDGAVVSDTPATVEWLEGFNDYVDSIAPDALVLGEVWSPSENVAAYVPEALDLAFEFELAEKGGVAVQERDATVFEAALTTVDELYPESQYATFLTNHDMNRLMSEVDGDVRIAKLAATWLLTSPGVPFVYYGEEVGLQGVKPDERIRTPMPWTDTPPGVGFTTGTPWQQPFSGYEQFNVESQHQDPDSLLSHYRTLIQDRATSDALRYGDLVLVESSHRSVLAYLRSHGPDHVLVVMNLSPDRIVDVRLDLDGGMLAGMAGVQAIVGPAAHAPQIDEQGGFASYRPLESLAPYGFLVLRFMAEPSSPPPPTTTTPTTVATSATEADVRVVEAMALAIEAGDFEAALGYFAPDAVFLTADGAAIGIHDPIPPESGYDATWDWDADGVVTISDIFVAQETFYRLLTSSAEGSCEPSGEIVRCTTSVTTVFGDLDDLAPIVTTQEFRVDSAKIVEFGESRGSFADPSDEAIWLEQFAAYETWVDHNHPEAYGTVFHAPCCHGTPDGLIFSPTSVSAHEALIAEWIAGQE